MLTAAGCRCLAIELGMLCLPESPQHRCSEAGEGHVLANEQHAERQSLRDCWWGRCRGPRFLCDDCETAFSGLLQHLIHRGQSIDHSRVRTSSVEQQDPTSSSLRFCHCRAFSNAKLVIKFQRVRSFFCWFIEAVMPPCCELKRSACTWLDGQHMHARRLSGSPKCLVTCKLPSCAS